MKPFQVVRTSGKKVTVRCPRKECGGLMTVHAKAWLEARPEKARSCTYCFKVSELPKRKS